ncbi:hypothetical protein GCM10019060_23580 [Novosphingobium pokkalii]|nr:hypothetical protein GCM10019060_23580 [Novosphingobium pokkalii]
MRASSNGQDFDTWAAVVSSVWVMVPALSRLARAKARYLGACARGAHAKMRHNPGEGCTAFPWRLRKRGVDGGSYFRSVRTFCWFWFACEIIAVEAWARIWALAMAVVSAE